MYAGMEKAMMTNALSQGTLLYSKKEKYEIVSVIGNGSFGITYHAKVEIMHGHIPIYGDVAIKEFFMPSICMRGNDGAISVNAVQRKTFQQCREDFKKEAEALQQMSDNEGVVKVNETFEANGTCYYVMEHLGDTTLKDYVSTKGPLDEAEAVSLFVRITAAVGSLHAQNRLHLDIKPSNIMMPNGTPKLIDFGQSVQFGRGGHTQRAAAACSDGYAPQEQYAGIRRFMPQTDIYALGAVLLFMVTGKRPPAAGELSLERLGQELPAHLSAETRGMILKCMAHEAKDRYSCTGEILRLLDTEVSADTDDEEDSTMLLQDRPSTYRRYSRKALGMAVGTVIALVLIAVVTLLARHADDDSGGTAQTVKAADSISATAAGTGKVEAQDEVTPVRKTTEQTATQPIEKEKTDGSATPQRQEAVRTAEHKPAESPGTGHGTHDLGWATWRGGTDDYGQPSGMGTLNVRRTRRLNDNVTVYPGDRIEECEFYQNRVYQGMLYRKGETTGEYINI